MDKEALSEDDKSELLKLFMVTGNPLIRDHIAMVFADIRYDKAVRYILRKINDKKLYGNNGTLVAALGDLNASRYYNEFAKIICTQDYEARLWALGLIEDFGRVASKNLKQKALKTLTSCKSSLGTALEGAYKNSRLHFIDEAIALIDKFLR